MRSCRQLARQGQTSLPKAVPSWPRSAAHPGSLAAQLSATTGRHLNAISDGGLGGSNEDAGSSEDYARVAASLNQLLTRASVNGRQLRELVVTKWGRSYDVRLTKFGSRMYLQVMWKFLEQQSFPLTEEEYLLQLDAVAEYITEWGVVDTVKNGIQRAPKPPGYTGGGNAKCVSIPLDVDLSGTRSAEWN